MEIKFTNSIIFLSVISLGIFLLSIFFFIQKTESQSLPGNKVKPILVLKDANRPSLSYDGKRIIEGPEIGLSEVFDVDTGKKLRTFPVKLSESQVISSDGSKVIIFSREIISITDKGYTLKGIFSIYEIDSGKLIRQSDANIVQDEKTINRNSVVSNEGGFNTKNISSNLGLVANRFFPENWSNPDSKSPAVILGSLEDNSLVKEFRLDDGFLLTDQWKMVSMTPDGKFVAAYRHNTKDKTRQKTVVWDVESGKIIFTLPFSPTWFSLSDNGKILAARRGDYSAVETWDVPTGKLISTLTETVNGRKVRISRGVISPSGKILVTTGNEEFYFWDVETGKFIASQRQDDHSEGIAKSATFSGNGKRIAIGSNTEVVTVWSVDEILKNENQTFATQ